MYLHRLVHTSPDSLTVQSRIPRPSYRWARARHACARDFVFSFADRAGETRTNCNYISYTKPCIIRYAKTKTTERDIFFLGFHSSSSMANRFVGTTIPFTITHLPAILSTHRCLKRRHTHPAKRGNQNDSIGFSITTSTPWTIMH